MTDERLAHFKKLARDSAHPDSMMGQFCSMWRETLDEVDRLRAEVAALRNPWRNVANELPDVGQRVVVRRVVNGVAEHQFAWLVFDDDYTPSRWWKSIGNFIRDLADYPEWMPLP